MRLDVIRGFAKFFVLMCGIIFAEGLKLISVLWLFVGMMTLDTVVFIGALVVAAVGQLGENVALSRMTKSIPLAG